MMGMWEKKLLMGGGEMMPRTAKVHHVRKNGKHNRAWARRKREAIIRDLLLSWSEEEELEKEERSSGTKTSA
jgi:hypothetical protein